MPIRTSLRREPMDGTVMKISAVVPDELGATLAERRGDDPELASYPRSRSGELEAGGLN
jgi:hypothetical protein